MRLCLTVLLLSAAATPALAASVTTLASFTGNPDAAGLSLGMVRRGAYLYGATAGGGAYGRGALFRLDPSSGAESVVYSFTGLNDGAGPHAALTTMNGLIYGTTATAPQSAATIFRFDPATATLVTLYRFPGQQAELSGLTPCGDLLYGTNSFYSGEIFSIDPRTGAEATAYSFRPGNGPTAPVSGLTASNGTLYGTAPYGGPGFSGLLFQFVPATGILTTLASFPVQSGGIQNPYAPPTMLGGTLYGIAGGGGPYTTGGIFAYDPATGLVQTVSATAGEDFNTGAQPAPSLLASGGVLYGVTPDGSVFSLDPASGTLRALYSFRGGLDGSYPDSTLAAFGGKLYGTTGLAGAANVGTIFALDPQTGQESPVHQFAGVQGTSQNGGVQAIGGMLYGTTELGGQHNFGTLYTVQPSTGAVVTRHDFANQGDGGTPTAPPAGVRGRLYGLTNSGGANDAGTAYAAKSPGTKLRTLASIPQGNPITGPLANLGGTLYGVQRSGGAQSLGAIVAIDPATGAQTTLYQFAAASPAGGTAPLGALLPLAGTLWGVTQEGGKYGYGTVFKYDPATGGETVLHDFAGGSDGQNPSSALISDGHSVFGVTELGGQYGAGVAFGMDAGTGAYTLLSTFGLTPTDGFYPVGPLARNGTELLGVTVSGGSAAGGTVFSLAPKTGARQVIYNFTGAADGQNPASGLLSSGAASYGTTTVGGAQNLGTIFQISP